MDEAIRIHFPEGRASRVLRAGCSAGSRFPEAVDGDELFIAAARARRAGRPRVALPRRAAAAATRCG